MSVATDLFLVRHGEAECNVAGVVGGPNTCTGLSDHGRQQVIQLGRRLACENRQRPFDAFYATPRQRVIDTADIIGAHLPLTATIVDDLRGPDHGQADGRSWSDVKSEFGGPPQHAPDRSYAPGSETWNQYLHRAHTVLREILSRHADERILVAAHGETVEALHVLLLELPPTVRLGVGFVTGHAAVTRWQEHVNRFDRRVWMLAAHNDISHLLPR
jgi:probable phosphoglycerate mutase